MKISRRVKRYHCPFGSLIRQSICENQWMVGANTEDVNKEFLKIDKMKLIEGVYPIYVMGPRSVEKLTR